MAKLTKKSYRRKRMLMGLALFMSVALISTGFAAWVISSSVEKNVDSNVQVGTVSDKSIGLTVEFMSVDGFDGIQDTDKMFQFEPNRKDRSGRVRYEGYATYFSQSEYNNMKDNEKELAKFPTDENDTNQSVVGYKVKSYSSTNYESLKVKLKITVTDPSGVLDQLNVSLIEQKATVGQFDSTNKEFKDVKYNDVAYAESNLYAAAQAQYINTPDCFAAPVNIKDLLVVDKDDPTKWSCEYEVAFTWGEYFMGVNPAYFYDGLDNSGQEQSDESIRNAGLLTNDKTVIDNLVDLRKTIYGITTGEKSEVDPETQEKHYPASYYSVVEGSNGEEVYDSYYQYMPSPKYRISVKAQAN